MKTTTVKEVKTGYVQVTQLEKGDAIVNLGIIKNIYPNPSTQQMQIIFEPKRALNITSYFYKFTDKLKIA